MKKINLFGLGVKSRSDFITSQRRVNVYYNLRQDGEKNQLVLIATPGLTLNFSLPTLPLRIMRAQNNYMYVVAGGTLYAVNPNLINGFVKLGSFSSSLIGSCSICFNETQLLLLDGKTAYYYPYASASAYLNSNPTASFNDLLNQGFQLTQVSGFPAPGAQTCICNDGYALVEQPNTGNWYISSNQDFSVWNILQSATMESFSDIIRAVDYVGGGIVAIMGQQSIEYWDDQPTDVSTFPYQRLNGFQVNYGLAAVFSRAQFMNGIAFLGQNQEGSAHVYMISPGATTPTAISSSDIDTLINSFEVISDAKGMAWDINGQQFYCLTFPTAGRTFLYEGTQTQTWTELQSGVADTAPWIGALATTFNNAILIADSAVGSVYELDPMNFTENGAQIKRELVTRELKMNGDKFKIPQLYLDMELGVGNPLTPMGVNPQITLEVSKNNGKSWSTPRPVSLGVVGNYISRVLWRRLGASRSFKLRLVATDVADFIITGGYADTAPGTKASG